MGLAGRRLHGAWKLDEPTLGVPSKQGAAANGHAIERALSTVVVRVTPSAATSPAGSIRKAAISRFFHSMVTGRVSVIQAT
jgi:hypothetical protein